MNEGEKDWHLVEAVHAGDAQAFEALMQRYKRPVLNFVYRLLNDAMEAEDAAQDVFVRTYRTIRKGRLRRSSSAFSTWLFQVARHAALDRLRRRRRHPESSLTPMSENGFEALAPGRTPAQDADAKALSHAIAEAVAALPEKQRTAMVLFEYEGCSQAEVAAVMRCSPKSVEARLSRARRSLRHRLARWM